jgi:NADH-quinone oxidoreductase subunit H
MSMVITIIEILRYIVPILLGVAFLTLAERKVIGSMQRRVGPNVIGSYGLLQPFADRLKAFVKETVLPNNANTVIFILAPILTLILSILRWMVIPLNRGVVISDINIGILYLFGISGLSVYGIIMSGWASNSKYAFLGGLRSAAQMISYEVCIGLVILSVIICAGSTNLSDIVKRQESIWYIIPLLPQFIMFQIAILAETNRHPFDLPEAERELVSGYNVEYSGMGFALFFIAEYSNIILMSTMSVLLFLGGWELNILPRILDRSCVMRPMYGRRVLTMKVIRILFYFIWVRAAFPRYRYDQLMGIGWKVLLPLRLRGLIMVGSIV